MTTALLEKPIEQEDPLTHENALAAAESLLSSYKYPQGNWPPLQVTEKDTAYLDTLKRYIEQGKIAFYTPPTWCEASPPPPPNYYKRFLDDLYPKYALKEPLLAPATPCMFPHAAPQTATDVTFEEWDVAHYLNTHDANDVIGVTRNSRDCLLAHALAHKYKGATVTITTFEMFVVFYNRFSVYRSLEMRAQRIITAFDALSDAVLERQTPITKAAFLHAWNNRGEMPIGMYNGSLLRY